MPGNRILLDNNVPRHLIPLLRPREATHAAAIGWATLGNGELIGAAHADGFAVMITCDQNIEHQQNLSGQPLAFVVLTTTHWATIRDNIGDVLAAVEAATPGSFAIVSLPKPARRRPDREGPERP
jgi:hypothetical protein